MKRPPTTFSLLLGLLALALFLALALATTLWVHTGRRVTSERYAQLVAATALAADELSRHHDPDSTRALATLHSLGVRTDVARTPPQDTRPRRMARKIGQTAGRLLGDPSRVQVRHEDDAQIWIRSAHDPQRWVVVHAVTFRQHVLVSSLVITTLIGLFALLIAAFVARRLTRPLEGLARHAGELLGGQPTRDTLRGSPREVCDLAAAIGAAGTRLRDAARERELMLAGISHDLRTPLARLRLALELGDASDTERREAMLADLYQLDNALEQCLAFVRDGSDEATREVDIATVAGQLLALRVNPDDWQLEAPAQLRAKVRSTLLRRAIGNLMDNAERHGAAPFMLDLAREGDGFALRIADHGPGANPTLLERLGEPFLRGDHARTSAGTGLGLSIVKRAAQVHGGTVHWHNAASGGFVVTLRIPAADANQQS